MSLVTSVSSLEGLDIQSGRTARSEQAEEGFQTVLKNKATESMDDIFEEAAAKYNVSVNLIKAVAKAESNFNPSAVSKSGAIGVMQLMPSTARSLGVTDPYDARQNIMGGAKYLRDNLDRFNGNVSLALAAYNAGPNAVQKYGGIPPYQETQNYVKIVTSYMGGSPIYSGKMVTSNSSSGESSLSRLGSLGTTYGLSSYDQLSRLYGLSGQSSYGMTSASTDTVGMLLGSATADGDGDTISLSKEDFVSLIEILRLQMMMNASREVGTITI